MVFFVSFTLLLHVDWRLNKTSDSKLLLVGHFRPTGCQTGSKIAKERLHKPGKKRENNKKCSLYYILDLSCFCEWPLLIAKHHRKSRSWSFSSTFIDQVCARNKKNVRKYHIYSALGHGADIWLIWSVVECVGDLRLMWEWKISFWSKELGLVIEIERMNKWFISLSVLNVRDDP